MLREGFPPEKYKLKYSSSTWAAGEYFCVFTLLCSWQKLIPSQRLSLLNSAQILIEP
jgi:hypothetical protein